MNRDAVFDMGKYNEYAPMLNIVCAQKDVEGTYQVVEQLLESVDSLYGFSRSKLYRHKKFKDTDGSYLQVIKEKLLEGFRNEEDLSFMKREQCIKRNMQQSGNRSQQLDVRIRITIFPFVHSRSCDS